MSLNTLLSRDDTVLAQERPTSPYHYSNSKAPTSPFHYGNSKAPASPYHYRNSKAPIPPVRLVLPRPSDTECDLMETLGQEIYQSTDEIREQQTDALLQEGTVADSGYVSACVSRSVKNSNPAEQMREDGALGQPEIQSRLTVDQQTVYTASVLPRASDYINDLCSDIYLKLKNELQEHACEGARAQFPRCLPDLIKAFSARIGLDRSEPSRAYIMHFLHKSWK